VLQTLYLNLLDKPWKKTIKFIDTAVIPIIKITATEEFNSMQMDISLQDGKHYGLKCVELVKSYMNEYEALEPLIFGLKNLLKNANLNDPYTVLLFLYITK
jgi:DNA polymerase sigma